MKTATTNPATMRAVRFDRYGGRDELHLADVEVPTPASGVVPKPLALSWDAAGSLYVAGATAGAAAEAVGAHQGETVAVSAAAGGVGSIAVQLLRPAGANVLAMASPANHAWLADHGAIPITYGPDLRGALSEHRIDAFVDLHGPQYLDLAVDLGVPASRINTIISFAKAAQIDVRAAFDLLEAGHTHGKVVLIP